MHWQLLNYGLTARAELQSAHPGLTYSDRALASCRRAVARLSSFRLIGRNRGCTAWSLQRSWGCRRSQVAYVRR
jgi:hypothetical protein